MEKLLLEKGLMALAREDFDLVSAVTQSEVQPNGKSCWKVAGGSRLSPRETTILQSLCEYRDRYAQKVDLPHFKVMSNDLLVEISRSMPQTQEELKDVPGMSDSLYRRHAEGLYNALKAGQTDSFAEKSAHKTSGSGDVEPVQCPARMAQGAGAQAQGGIRCYSASRLP